MTRPWDPAIRRLQRRVRLAGALESAARWLVPGALLTVAYVGLAFVSPWARFLAPYAGAAAAAVLAALVVTGWLRGRRSEIYCAKWIDLESRLEDRLASAVEWSRLPSPDPFQARCIEQFSLDLGARRFRLLQPRTRPPRLWLSALSALVVAGVVTLHTRKPAPVLERDARQKLTLAQPVAEAAAKEVSAARSNAAAIADPELERMATDLSALVQAMGQGTLDRETSLAQIEQLRRRADEVERRAGPLGQLGDKSASGPAGEIARAIAAGDPKQLHGALGNLADQLQAGSLSDADLGRVEPLLDSLAGIASGTNAELARHLSESGRQIRAGDQPVAARELAAALADFAAVEKPLRALAAAQRVDQTLAMLERATRAEEDPLKVAASLPGGPERGDPDAPVAPGEGDSRAGLTRQGSSGAGADAPTSHGAPEPTSGDKGTDLQVRGTWNGKVLRQLFDTSSTAGPSDEVRDLLVEHERVVEDRFRHDDVPLEYRDAVRAYFAALHQKR